MLSYHKTARVAIDLSWERKYTTGNIVWQKAFELTLRRNYKGIVMVGELFGTAASQLRGFGFDFPACPNCVSFYFDPTVDRAAAEEYVRNLIPSGVEWKEFQIHGTDWGEYGYTVAADCHLLGCDERIAFKNRVKLEAEKLGVEVTDERRL